ncbi:MAG TPA: TrkA family potassium uptake protein [Actinomycetes bacterium]|nr:TrkA family potassium uptake protein [Actinomycetes bacterium]
MRVAIAGAGKVGRSIAAELLMHGHEVLLIDPEVTTYRTELADARWLQADACEISSLDQAHLQSHQVVIAATGDDKVNLVISLLAKTEYGVPRVVARVNHPKNEWLFTEGWGVDVAVSTPRLLSALVEEAVSVGDVVRLMEFEQGDANLVEITLPASSPVVGSRVGSVTLPPDTTLVTIVRDRRVITPSDDDSLEAGDELLFVTTADSEDLVQQTFSPHAPIDRAQTPGPG